MALYFTNSHDPASSGSDSDSAPDKNLYAEGTNGTLRVNDETIELIRSGLTAKLLRLRGNKEILISEITSIQFKSPGMLTNGFIQFAFPGSQESKGGVLDATKDENSIVFTKKQARKFEYLRDIINRKRNESRTSHKAAVPANASSSYSDLEKLAELRDKGILTNEEFVSKKKQILGL